jgi:hypothetical protein
MKPPTPYAVLITMLDSENSTHGRVYLRSRKRISKVDFDAYAIGDMLRLVGNVRAWSIENVTNVYYPDGHNDYRLEDV